MSASPLGIVGDVAEDAAAALGHAVHFALLDLEAVRLGQIREHLGDQDHALAANADDQHVDRRGRVGRHASACGGARAARARRRRTH
jgi:hypothetical protein